ncbi:hypothetical protein [Acinetobacter vivianii]|uniref:hypothetical protein n=1 Tax=Acinetobacter vivianii TaxID=1776742 RepID=UPI00039C2080|nr:hypothetical protein [Acinetobacter vivianii]
MNQKDESVIGLLHSFVSLGVLSLCIGFVIKTLVAFNYIQHNCWENIIYLLSGLIALIPLFFLFFYSIKSMARAYLESLSLNAHWFYTGIVIIAGASMILVFPAFNFLNSNLYIEPVERPIAAEKLLVEKPIAAEKLLVEKPIAAEKLLVEKPIAVEKLLVEKPVSKSTDFSILEAIKILFAIFIAALGWIVAHYFTAKRDLNNSRRLARIEALSSCYKIFVRSGINGSLIHKRGGEVIDIGENIEDAILMIHLYGSQEQSELANQYVNDLSTNQNADSTKLVNSLRKDIRGMLGEQDLTSTPSFLKINRY